MKKTLNKHLILSLAALPVLATSLTGCGGGGDSTKTQISVFNYNGGFGSDWLNGVKERFEAKFAETSFEEGKTGVEIQINPLKTSYSSQEIALGDFDVYFHEHSFYDELRSVNAIADISDIVTETSEFDNKTIASKLSKSQEDFLGVTEGGSKHYYALPHYMGGSGLIYNIELFDKYGLYFIDRNGEPYPADESLNFIGNYPDPTVLKKSTGPDGYFDTEDDGLPATYQEFFMLCRQIVQKQAIPLVWNGYRNYNYTNAFINALVTQAEGSEKMMLNYALNGTDDDLVKTSATEPDDGVVPVSSLESVVIEDSVAGRANVQRQVGKYYALDFFSTIVKNSSDWTNGSGYNNGYTHTAAQQDFIWGSKASGAKDIAMLVEGVWAMNEGKSCFTDMEARFGSEYGINKRNFGWMNLPRPNQSYVDAHIKNTISDNLSTLCFASSKLKNGKLQAAKKFIQFVNSDNELVAYTKSTNTMKALKYTMTPEELNELSPFGRSLHNYVQSENTDIIFPYSHAATYAASPDSFTEPNAYRAKVGTTTYAFPINAFHSNSPVTAWNYFKGLL
ncbi:MAG: extracellular solute-binding protein [Bacilli bacterium]|nr:extracellular solute-binding protein [Bacilli bacterium]